MTAAAASGKTALIESKLVSSYKKLEKKRA